MKWMTNHVYISWKNENWPTTQRKHKFEKERIFVLRKEKQIQYEILFRIYITIGK